MPLALFLLGCEDQMDSEFSSITLENKLIGNWTYESVAYEGNVFAAAEDDFDLTDQSLLASVGRQVNLRHVRYTPEHTYQLSWDAGRDYLLGTGPNWQPELGFWIIQDNSLIHNPEQYYEVSYAILELTQDRFVRQSKRIMSTTLDSAIWAPGDTILFTEIFVPKE